MSMRDLWRRLLRIEDESRHEPFAPDGTPLCTLVLVRPIGEGESPGWYPPVGSGSSVGYLLTERAPHGGATDEKVPEGVLADYGRVIRIGPTISPRPVAIANHG